MVNPSHGRFETRYSERGYAVQVWVCDMPRIDDGLLDSIVYLFPSEAAAEDGEKLGGSGFLYGVKIPETRFVALFVVTNRHVVENGSMTVRLNTVDGRKDSIPLDGAEWFYHPDGDDLAACPIGINKDYHRNRYIDADSNLRPQFVKDFNIGVGDDTFMIGRFVGFEGKQQNLPSVRFGNISQMPVEPIIQSNGFAQESFLIEARSIPGYSGSPVFITIEPHGAFPFSIPEHLPNNMKEALVRQSGFIKERAGPMRFGPFLFGIDYCHLYDRQRVRSERTGEPVNDWYVQGNSGMMGVIPAWRLTDMFMRNQKLKAAFDSIAATAQKNARSSNISLDVADGGSSPPASDANPTHREDFTHLVGAAARKPPQEG